MKNNLAHNCKKRKPDLGGQAFLFTIKKEGQMNAANLAQLYIKEKPQLSHIAKALYQ